MNDEHRKLLKSFDTGDFPVVRRAKQDGFTAEIVCDTDTQLGDPRDGDCNVGVIWHWHRRYTIASDAVDISRNETWPTIDDVHRAIERDEDAVCILPLGMYDHSGVSFYVGSSPIDAGGWDSGQVGFIFATKESCEHVGIDPADKEAVERALRGEVRCLDAYARGNVYFHRITDAKGDEVDACYGYLAVENDRGEPYDDGLDDLRYEIFDLLTSYADDEREARESAERIGVPTV